MGQAAEATSKMFGAAWEVTSKGDQNTNSDAKFYVGFVVTGPGVTDVALLVSEVKMSASSPAEPLFLSC